MARSQRCFGRKDFILSEKSFAFEKFFVTKRPKNRLLFHSLSTVLQICLKSETKISDFIGSRINFCNILQNKVTIFSLPFGWPGAVSYILVGTPNVIKGVWRTSDDVIRSTNVNLY
jgi:hypothetical protein